jgi:F0F1-type ATP synthase assembly protein I
LSITWNDSILNFVKDTETGQQYTLDISGETAKVTPRVEDKNKKSNELAWYYLGVAGNLGLSISIPLVLCIFLGIYLDTKLGTKPQCLLGGFVVGIVFSVLSLVHTVQAVLKEPK